MFPAALLILASAAPQTDLEDLIRSFAGVYAAVEREAADPVNPDRAMYAGAMAGMLRRLDPHCAFFDPGQFEQLQELERSTRKGFGSIVSVLPGRVIVLQTLPGTPSARSGIMPGDEILAINGYRLDMLDMEQLIELLTQSRQQQVKLDVRRQGNARLLDFVLTPEELQSPSVERVFFVGPGIGYIRLGSFDAQTGAELREAVEKLGGRNLRGLVLDLRNNPGGVMSAALDAAALFLKPGQKLLSIRGRSAEAKEMTVPAGVKPYGFPLAVLINGRSASASEIVAGAFQDHRRAVILGEPSFGKGLVQSVYTLSSRTGLALTTAYYYTPLGRTIQRPLHGSQLDAVTAANTGGIRPDRLVHQEPQTRLRIALDGSGSFTSFATDYVRGHTVADDFEITPAVLDDFQVYASSRNIRPGVNEWLADAGWIRMRLKTEILNQSLGVAKGDEVEVRGDPQVKAAVRALEG